MTICIAALAEGKKRIILVADQMITASIPIAYQFETSDVRKIYDLSSNVVLLTAGNALFASEIFEKSKKEIEADKSVSPENRTVEQLAEIVRRNFQILRRGIVERSVLEPRGLNLSSYYQMQQKLHQAVVQEVENQLINTNIGVDLIVAGHDPSGGCHIYSVTHPGIAVCHDELGYVAVGSGAPHAMYSIIGSSYKKSLPLEEVKKIASEAKKKSEVAPGVGVDTTIQTLPNDGGSETS